MSEHSSLFIEDLHNCYYVRPRQFSCVVEQNWSFMDHLSGALPTRNIFNLLDEIRSGPRKFGLRSLIRPYQHQYNANMVYKVIIKWLEVCFRESNRQLDTPPTNNPICSRDLVPSDRATCTIASKVNFILKKNLRQPGRTGFP